MSESDIHCKTKNKLQPPGINWNYLEQAEII